MLCWIMARLLRIEFPGAIYHITSGGNARRVIFLDDKDRADFLEVVCFVVKRFNRIVENRHACSLLMSNHYHLFIEIPEVNLSRGMRHLNGLYTQRPKGKKSKDKAMTRLKFSIAIP